MYETKSWGGGNTKKTWTKVTAPDSLSSLTLLDVHKTHSFPFTLTFSDSKCLNIMWEIEIAKYLNSRSSLHLSV